MLTSSQSKIKLIADPKGTTTDLAANKTVTFTLNSIAQFPLIGIPVETDRKGLAKN